MRNFCGIGTRTLVSLAASVTLVAGCQAPMPTGSAPSTSVVQGPQARVELDLKAVKRAWGQVLTATVQPFEVVSELRLRVVGPGITSDLSTTITWTDDTLQGDATNPIAELSLQVPAGLNRVFVLEGLNADGKVLRVLRGLGAVTANQPLTLTMNYLTDAAGRTLEALIAPPPTGETDRRTALASTDLVAKLLAYVDGYLAFDAATNVYTGAVAPYAFNHLELAKQVRQAGFAFLDGTTTLPALEVEAIASHTVAVTDDQGAPVDGASVYLFAPLAYTPGQPELTTAGEAVFARVPIGTWSVVAVKGTRRVWGTVTVTGSTAGETTLVLPAAVVLPDVSTVAGVLDAPDTPFLADIMDGGNSVSGDVIAAVAAGNTGEAYFATHGQIWRKTAQGQYYRIYGKRPFDAVLAPFSTVTCMTTDPAGNLYVSATTPGSWGHTIYKFSQADIAGLTANGDLTPAPFAVHLNGTLKLDTDDMTVHNGTLYVLNSSWGVRSYPLSDTSGSAPDTVVVGTSNASLSGLAIDAAGTVYVSDITKHAVYRVTDATTLSRVAGVEVTDYKPGGDAVGDALTAARFNRPKALAFHPDGRLLVAEADNHRIKAIDLVGSSVAAFSGDGTVGDAAGARYNGPVDLAVDPAGTVFVADSGNDALRQVSTTGVLSTLKQYQDSRYKDASGAAARFGKNSYDIGFTADSLGNLYLADRHNGVIRRIDADGNVTTYAGTGQRRATDGSRAQASFYYPKAMASDGQGNLYVVDDNTIRVVSDTGVTTSSASFSNLYTLAGTATGTVYAIGRQGGQYRLVTLQGGIQTASVALSQQVSDVTCAAVKDGVVYTADFNANKIYAIDANGTVTHFAGEGFADSQNNANPLLATFNRPHGLAVDGDRLLVADNNGRCLRAIDLGTGAVSTVTGGGYGSLDGSFASASFAYPVGLAVTADAIFLTDEYAIRRIAR